AIVTGHLAGLAEFGPRPWDLTLEGMACGEIGAWQRVVRLCVMRFLEPGQSLLDAHWSRWTSPVHWQISQMLKSRGMLRMARRCARIACSIDPVISLQKPRTAVANTQLRSSASTVSYSGIASANRLRACSTCALA